MNMRSDVRLFFRGVGHAETSEKKLRHNQSELARQMQFECEARHLVGLGTEMTLVVPAYHRAEESITLNVLYDKSATVTLEVTLESLAWLHTWVQSELNACDVKQRPRKAH